MSLCEHGNIYSHCATCSSPSRNDALALVAGISEEASAIREDWTDPRGSLRLIQEYCDKLRTLLSETGALQVLRNIIDSYDMRSELYTNDADCAGNLADKARAFVAGKALPSAELQTARVSYLFGVLKIGNREVNLGELVQFTNDLIQLYNLKGSMPSATAQTDEGYPGIAHDFEAMRLKLLELCDRIDWKGPAREANLAITVQEARAMCATDSTNEPR